MFGSPRPAWSGMMQLVQQGVYSEKSTVMFLPMIDMNPSDASCIYSTLVFVSEHARCYNILPVITFDQPLWWKAFMITVSEPLTSDLRNIVLCLGGFHTEMSFQGCIGHLMAGLQEVFQLIYAANSVVHMLAGKAIARAVWAHFIVDADLNAILLSNAMDIPLFSTSDEEAESSLEEVAADLCSRSADLQEASVLYNNLMNGTVMFVERVLYAESKKSFLVRHDP